MGTPFQCFLVVIAVITTSRLGFRHVILCLLYSSLRLLRLAVVCPLNFFFFFFSCNVIILGYIDYNFTLVVYPVDFQLLHLVVVTLGVKTFLVLLVCWAWREINF